MGRFTKLFLIAGLLLGAFLVFGAADADAGHYGFDSWYPTYTSFYPTHDCFYPTYTPTQYYITPSYTPSYAPYGCYGW